LHLTRITRIFVGLMAVTALATIANALHEGVQWHPYPTLALIAIAALTSQMRVKIPGISGSMSVNLPFLLIAVLYLSSFEAILVAAIAAAVQTLPFQGGSLKPAQMVFNASMMTFASGAASLLARHRALGAGVTNHLLLVGMSVVFFLGQTVPVSTIIALTEGGSLAKIWAGIVKLTFPYYVLSTGIASMVRVLDRPGVIAGLLVAAVMYGTYRSYQAYFAKPATSPRPAAVAAVAGH